MAEDKIRMPMTEAGLVRYGDEQTSRRAIKPEHVLALAFAIIIIAIALHALI